MTEEQIQLAVNIACQVNLSMRTTMNMSHKATDQTKLGLGFDVTSISGAGATIYANEVEMEDTASSSVRIVGETIPESNESSLGLTRLDVPTEQSTEGVTGLCMMKMWSIGDADAGSTANSPGGEHVSNPSASGS